MAASVSEAYGILKGVKTGSLIKAQEFLDSMPDTEKVLRNRNESRLRFVKRVRNPLATK